MATFKQYRFELSAVYCNGGGAGWTAPTPGTDADGQTFAQVARTIVGGFVCEHIGVPSSPYRAQIAGHLVLKHTANDGSTEKTRLAFFPHDKGSGVIRVPAGGIAVAADEYIQCSYTASGASGLQMNPTVIIQCLE